MAVLKFNEVMPGAPFVLSRACGKPSGNLESLVADSRNPVVADGVDRTLG